MGILNSITNLFRATPKVPTVNVPFSFAPGTKENDLLSGGVDWASLKNSILAKNADKQTDPAQAATWASGMFGIAAQAVNDKAKYNSLNAQAKAYESQIALNNASYRNQIGYIAEQNFADVSRIISEYDEFQGQQMVAAGASGFDISAGEQRLTKDTTKKRNTAVDLRNRNAFNQSYEIYRSTMIENIRLQAAADMARRQAKFTRNMGYFNIAAGIVSTAAKAYQLNPSQKRTQDVDVKGVVKNANTYS